MKTPKRKLAALAVVGVSFVVLLRAFFTLVPLAPETLQVNILGQTNLSSGATMAFVQVTNNTARPQIFSFQAEVQTASGWADAKNWVPQHPGQTYCLKGHEECRLIIPAPEKAISWRFRLACMPQVSKFQWKWYILVRRSGLNRLGFQEQPPASYYWTAKMAQ